MENYGSCYGCDSLYGLACRYKSAKGWRLQPAIVKSMDDLRQEQFALQLIFQFHSIFQEAGLPLYLCPYLVIATGPDCGFIEAVPDTVSIDSLRRTTRPLVAICAVFSCIGSELRARRTTAAPR